MIPPLGVIELLELGKPRASGDDPLDSREITVENIVNPARAGMIPYLAGFPHRLPGKPRASGDDPSWAARSAVRFR